VYSCSEKGPLAISCEDGNKSHVRRREGVYWSGGTAPFILNVTKFRWVLILTLLPVHPWRKSPPSGHFGEKKHFLQLLEMKRFPDRPVFGVVRHCTAYRNFQKDVWWYVQESFLSEERQLLCGVSYVYSRDTAASSTSFCVTTFRASLTNLTPLLPQSHDRSCYVSGPILALAAETHWSTPTWHRPLCRLVTSA
jgi:hypothetical protein